MSIFAKSGTAAQKHTDETTELVFILDRSGSMSGLEKDTIGGFNSMIQKQRKQPGRCKVTTVLFDDKVEVLHRGIDVQKLAPMTGEQYWVRGCTALLDAVGSTIKSVNASQKASVNGRPDHTIVVITTDGYENASTRYTLDKVRKLITRRTQKNGWEFVFLGANMDAVQTAAGLGIAEQRAATYTCDSAGTAAMFAAADEVLCSIRADECPTASWKAPIEADRVRRQRE